MSLKRTVLLPLIVVLLGVAGAIVIVKARPKVERTPVDTPDPAVRVVEVHPATVTLRVASQGTVRARTESTLVTQVSGQIVSVGPAFAEGGFFQRGDLLVGVDPRDYELAAARAESELAQATLRLRQEEAQAVVAREEWEELGSGDPSPLTLREPQLAEALAGVRAADSSLAQAKLDLSRTKIRAPFDGRVRAKRADLGQFVAPGTPLADLFAVDYVEVRLPVAQDQLAYLDVALDGVQHGDLGEAYLSANLGGELTQWTATVTRVAGELDARTRMFNLIVQVEDPYRLRSQGPVLPVGLFVTAEIMGTTVDNVFEIPRTALRDRSRVLVLEDDDRLRFRPVELLRVQGESVLVAEGLQPGDLVCVSALDAVVDGMRVEPMREESMVGGS